MEATILVADDEKKIARMIASYLEASGFKTILAYDGLQALDLFKKHNPDCIILDINMPECNGLNVGLEIRKNSSVPIIFLTARTDEVDRIVGLELGADDYISKPFSPRELVARINAIFRRTIRSVKSTAVSSVAGEKKEDILRYGVIEIDIPKRIVKVAGSVKILTTLQMDILVFLMRNPGRVFSRMEILESCLGATYEGYERTIDAHIKNIRKALGDDSDKPCFIGTIRGVGYKFLEQPE